MRKPTILIMSSTFPRWKGDTGPARFVFDLCLHLAPFYQVVVLAPHAHGALRHERFDDIEVFRFPYFYPLRSQALCNGMGILPSLKTGWLPKLQIPTLFLGELYGLHRLLKHKRIDLINSHWMIPQGWNAAIIKRRISVPHLMTIHSADIHTLQRLPGGRAACRFIVRRSDYIVPVSRHLHRLLEQVMGHAVPARVLPMGVDARKFSVEMDRQALRTSHKIATEFVLLFVGRLIPFKGVSVLLQAMKKLQSHIDATLLIAGSGNLRTALESEARDFQLGDRVRFLGPVDHDTLPALYCMSDVVVLPSLVTHQQTEGTPVVLLEAMAAGRPVVGSNVGGIGDVIQDRQNGRLVSPGDPDALADAILSVLQPGIWPIWGQHARETGKRYDWTAIAGQYRDMMDRLIANGGRDSLALHPCP